jgi:hypothetical protein
MLLMADAGVKKKVADKRDKRKAAHGERLFTFVNQLVGSD